MSFLLQLVESWTARCKELEIPVSDELSLVSVLGDSYEIRQWNINGLPRDSVSFPSCLHPVVTKYAYSSPLRMLCWSLEEGDGL